MDTRAFNPISLGIHRVNKPNKFSTSGQEGVGVYTLQIIPGKINIFRLKTDSFFRLASSNSGFSFESRLSAFLGTFPEDSILLIDSKI
jgi:hypothetical protein